MRNGVDVVRESAIGEAAIALGVGPLEVFEEAKMATRVGLEKSEVDARLGLCERFVQGLDDSGTVSGLDRRSCRGLDKVSELSRNVEQR